MKTAFTTIAAVLMLIAFTANIYGQNTDLPFYQKGTTGWYKMKTDARLSVKELLEKHTSDLGLSQWDEFKSYHSETDELGITHYRFQQYHRGIPVENGILLIHEKWGKVITFNGQWSKNLNLSTNPAFSDEHAIEKALTLLPAERYMWEDEGAEAMFSRIHQKNNASFYPQAELVWVSLDFFSNDNKLQLAYKMEIQAQVPLFRQRLYLDAQSGKIIQNINLLHESNVPGTADTKYSGTRQITTDSIAPGMYRLRETGRGGGIETYDMNGGLIFGNAVDFTDTDNHWDNVNDEQDEAATDAHWAAEMTFDYLKTKHNYTGINNNGMPFISYVHYDENLVNAFWNGSWASFGDGSGNTLTALTSIDIVAHEFAHGITGSNANLIYLNESGALNESFSDIFGAAVEFWASPEQADWSLGEDFSTLGNVFRRMDNPNAEGHPDTYNGNLWYNGTGDNGGVHINSGVQNYWFYLLTEGGNGINDHGEPFDLNGLGIDTAMTIAFRNLRFYLTTTSQYFDAREGALQAAEDLYGACSHAQIETAQAWQAVGLGNPIADNDIALKQLLYPTSISCGLTNTELPLLQIQYNGCATPISAATPIPIAFQLNNGPIVNDTITLSSDFSGGEFLMHQSDKMINGLEEMGAHTLKIWIAFDQDPTPTNDTLEFEIQNIIEQNIDFGLASLPSPRSNCFLTNEDVVIEIGFFGCDSIVAGTELNIFYRLNEGDTITETAILPHTVYSFETYNHTFSASLDFTELLGTNRLESWVEFAPDFLNTNDILDIQFIVNPKVVAENNVLTFEAGDVSLDSVYIETNRESDVFMSSDAAATGMTGIQMTGGDVISSFDELVIPNDLNIWQVNDIISAKTCLCVDASNMNDLHLSFDLKQTYSTLYLISFGMDLPQASSLRLLANGSQFSQTFSPFTHRNDPIRNHSFHLGQYANSAFELCFETRNALHPSLDPFGIGDNAFIDNIRISEMAVATSDINQGVSSLSIIPNPFSEQTNIAIENDWTGRLNLRIVNMLGQLVFNTELEKSDHTLVLKFDGRDLPKGMYKVLLSGKNKKSAATKLAVTTFVKI